MAAPGIYDEPQLVLRTDKGHRLEFLFVEPTLYARLVSTAPWEVNAYAHWDPIRPEFREEIVKGKSAMLTVHVEAKKEPDRTLSFFWHGQPFGTVPAALLREALGY